MERHIYRSHKHQAKGSSRILFAILAIVAVLGTLAGWEYNTTKQAETDSLRKVRKANAETIATRVAEREAGIVSYLQVFASCPLLTDALITRNNRALLPPLRDAIHCTEDFDKISIYTKDGTLMANDPFDRKLFGLPSQNRVWYQGVSRNWTPFISDLYPRRPNHVLSIAVAVPVKTSDGRVIGIINGVQGESLLREIVERGKPPGIHTVIFDGNGTVIYDSVGAVQSFGRAVQVLRLKGTMNGNCRISSIAGEPQICATAPIPGTGWSVLVYQPLAGSLPYTDRLRMIYLEVAIPLFLLIYFLSLLHWRHLCERERLVLQLEQHEHQLEERVIACSSSLTESELKYRTLFETANEAVLLLDSQGRFVEVNKSACSRYGYNRDEFLHMDIDDLSAPGEISAKDWLTRTCGAGVALCQSEHITRDGTVIAVEVSAQVVQLEASPIFMLTIRDVTEHKRTEKVLQEAAEKAQEANRAKTEFLATMSHEMRTPLHGVIGFINLALVQKQAEKQREYLMTAHTSAEILLTVINDILDLSKIEAGKLTLEPAPFNLRQLVEDTVCTFELRAKERELDLHAHVKDDVPPYFLGDPVRIRQILFNLISNAVKFTQDGTVEVTVDIISQNDDVVELSFAVNDSGIGIPANKLDRLFQRFSQVDGSNTRKHGGTGLGLAITKQLVEMMGGAVSVQSKEGVGSTFRFTLILGIVIVPPEQPRLEDKATLRNLAAPPEVNQVLCPRVLLAEDNTANQQLVRELLEVKGWQAIVVGDGKCAVRAMREGEFDVVLMDVQMPIMDGLEATRLIRQEELLIGRHTPIIALTASVMSDGRKQCLEAGMDDFIFKPMKLEVFYATIEKYINHGNTRVS